MSEIFWNDKWIEALISWQFLVSWTQLHFLWISVIKSLRHCVGPAQTALAAQSLWESSADFIISVTIKRTIIIFQIFKLKNHNKYWPNSLKSLINFSVKNSKQLQTTETESLSSLTIEKLKNIFVKSRCAKKSSSK